MYLLDINIWLAVTFDVHVHHKFINEWFKNTEDNSCFFCRMTQQGFLRLSTNPAVFGNETISLKKAWKVYDTLSNDPRVLYKTEPEEIELIWREFTLNMKFGHKIWNDAYLAAFAKCSKLTMVSLDKGFHRFTELKSIILDRKDF